MKLTANWRTALLAGLWTGLGALVFEAFVIRGGVARENQPMIFITGLIPFFFIPVFLFVFGRRSKGSPIKQMGLSLGRGLVWMAGVAAVLMPGLPLVSHLYAS